MICIHLVDRLFSKKSLHGPVHPGAALLLLLLAIAREEPSCHRVRGFFSLASSISFHSLPYTHSLLPFRSFSILLAVPTDSDPPYLSSDHSPNCWVFHLASRSSSSLSLSLLLFNSLHSLRELLLLTSSLSPSLLFSLSSFYTHLTSPNSPVSPHLTLDLPTYLPTYLLSISVNSPSMG